MLGILLAVLSIACGAGFIWLLIRAFQTSVVWGILVFLFSPITATIFAIKHWEEAKKPFLLYATTISSALILTIYMIMSSGIGEIIETSVELAKETKQGTMTEEEAAKILVGKISDKAFEAAKNMADGENDKAFLGILHRYVNTQRTGSSGLEQNELKKDIKELLKRTDFTEDQRKGLKNLLKELNEQNENMLAGVTTPGDQTTHQQAEMEMTPKNQEIPEVLPVAVPGNPNDPLRPGKINIESGLFSPENSLVEEFKPDFQSDEVPSSPFKAIRFSQAKKYIGSEIVFVNPNGGEEKCFLVEVSNNELQCEMRFNAGTFSTSYKESEVKSLKVVQN